MREVSKTSDQTTLRTTRNAISSLASAHGLTLSDKQDGPTIEKSGLEVARVNLSPQQANGKDSKMKDICGPSGSLSLKSATLSISLANKLRQRTHSCGSTLFRLTWKERITPSGRSIPALRASVLRTSDRDSTGWPTPNSEGDTTGGGCIGDAIKKANGEKRPSGASRGSKLKETVLLSSWPTPMAGSPATETYNEAGNTDSSRKTVALVAPWSTPRANKWGFPDAHGSHEAPWATPKSTDTKGNPYTPTENRRSELRKQVSGVLATGSPASTERSGQLNPAHSRWLMGLPTAWDDCGATVIRSSRRKPKLLSKPISKSKEKICR